LGWFYGDCKSEAKKRLKPL